MKGLYHMFLIWTIWRFSQFVGTFWRWQCKLDGTLSIFYFRYVVIPTWVISPFYMIWTFKEIFYFLRIIVRIWNWYVDLEFHKNWKGYFFLPRKRYFFICPIRLDFYIFFHMSDQTRFLHIFSLRLYRYISNRRITSNWLQMFLQYAKFQ